MWLVKMPQLSPINHGPLFPALPPPPAPPTAGDNIYSERCCCRLSNYKQHDKGSSKALHCTPQVFAVLFNIKKALIHVKARASLIEPLFGFDPPRFSGGVVTCERRLSAL